ncbi:Ribosomal lysine N-methyltransferase 4 [Rhizina undulata]
MSDMEIDQDPFHQLNNAFTRWLVDDKNVILNPNIAVADLRVSGAGRGVVALKDLQEDEIVFSIPRISVLSVENSELYQKIPTELSSLDQWLALILVSIYETRPASPWKPYMDLLPRSFNSLMFWTPSELSELSGSAVLNKIGKEEAEATFMEKLWDVVKHNHELFRNTDIDTGNPAKSLVEAAHRMGSIIMSYSFDLESPAASSKPASSESDSDSEEEEEGTYYKAMVPLADLLNANGHLNNCRLFHTPQALEMKTITVIPAGGELYNDYGPLPRSDLLRRYGYITSHYAPYDVVELSSQSIISSVWPPKDNKTGEAGKEKTERIDYLLDEEILDDGFDIGTTLEIPPEILVTLHTFLLSSGEFRALKRKGKVPKPRKTREVKNALVGILEARLKEYATSVDEDEEMLKSGVEEQRKRMAVEVRLGEKKILVGALEEVRGWVIGEGKRERGEDGTGGDGKRARR